MILIAAQIRHARLELAQANDLPGTILRTGIRFIQGMNAKSHDFGVTPTMTTLQPQQDFARTFIQTGMNDICHAVYITLAVYSLARIESGRGEKI